MRYLRPERNMTAVILAAGKSRRMNSGFSKVLHKIYGRPMLEYVIDSVSQCGIKDIIIVTNTEENVIRQQEFLPKSVRVAKQKRLLGTAHALRQTLQSIYDVRMINLNDPKDALFVDEDRGF